MTIVHFQPRFLRVTPKTSMVTISATWPIDITGMIQLPGMPTPPLSALALKKVPVQLK